MMSFKEFKATVSTARVAGPQNEIKTIPTKSTVKNHLDSSKEHTNVLTSTSNTASSSISSSSSSLPSASSTTMQEEQHVKMCKLFTFIEDTYRDIRRFNSGLYKDSYSTQLMQSINKYKNGCNEIFGKVLESYDMSFMLSQNIVRTIDIFKELGTCFTDMEEYQYRICEIMSIFIVCELRLSVDANPQEQLSIAHRIIYIMRRHLVQEEEHETLYNILRTLVYIPKLYNARDIMCAIFGEFIPIKPVPEVNVLPDKLYMLYIIVFYRWMMMQKDDDDKLLIVNFAESFMKPSVSLCSNNLYGAYLPMYTTHSTATRTILNNLKFYRDIRNASIIDNALKTIGSVVNLCDDDEDEDVIVIDSSPATDFAQIFATALLEPLNGSLTNIKLEEKTVVGLVDLTMDEEPTNSQNSIVERHDKWLNEFQQLAKQYREAQLLLEKQQNNQLNASGKKETVICLDSDSEEEAEEEISAEASKEKPETAAAAAAEEAATQNKPCEDLFIDNYPLTNTPIHCDTDLESLDADDNDDATKISSRFFTGTLRTYQAKKSNLSETEDKNHSDADESNNRSLSMNNAYRRDSIHISSSPPDGVDNEEDEGTDVQDEHDDGLLDEEEEEEEANAYTFLPTTSKQTENSIRPMGPYPTYNNMHNNSNNHHNNKLVLSQSLSRYQPDKQYYSDSSEVKAHSKLKKRVQFNTSPLGPTASSSANLKMPLKPALQQQKYKAADAPEYFHLRGFERFPGGPSVASSTSTSISTSTTSSIKHQEQQEHLAAAATLFRNIFDRPRVPYPYSAPFSPSSSSLSSPSTTTPKKSRLPKSKLKQRRPTIAARDDLNNMKLADNNHTERFSIIRNREVLNDGYHSTGPPGMSSYVESSDECYAVASDSDIFINERYKNDAKLRKRCAVVITPTKELLQYERKRDEMYNEILIKQRRKLELRTMAKQREKERRRLSKEKKEQTQSSDKGVTDAALERVKDRSMRRKSRNYTEIFMSSESEFETNFQVRTRKQRQKFLPDLQPLNIEIGMTDAATTSSLLSQIDAHLNSPQKSKKQQPKKQPAEQATANDSDINQITCDINDPGQQTKMRELNLLADIAQHLSPYQLQLPETPLPALDAIQTPKPKEKVTVTEHLIIKSSGGNNLLETIQTQPQPQVDINDQQQQATTPSYAHEPKLNIAAILNSSPSEKSSQNHNPQNNTQLEHNDNTLLTNNVPDKVIQTEETLEQILEESISVLKSVTSPFNPLNASTTPERAETHSESTIPLLISNVESLNRYEPNDLCVAKQKPVDKEHLLSKETTNENSEKLVPSTNGETHGKPKDLMMEQTDNESANVLSSNILNNVESSILCGADLSNISSETEISHGIKVPSLMTADLSDISLESEISKHLPDIAEPSPVVTDMSDNSNESCVSKTFGLQTPIINNNSTTDTAEVPVMTLPDLSFVMPSLTQPPATLPTNQQDCLERNFNHLNSTLNTPIKLADMPRAEEAAANPLNDLNTPMKFALAPAELENHNTPLKIALEPENDNNVTKFLDLILNKTVTDAESETRDKIIKELNALTADTTATATDTSETGSNTEITPPVETATANDTSETGSNYEITPPVETVTATNTSKTGSSNEMTPPVETATATDTSETGSNNEITPPIEAYLPQDSGHKTIETKEAVFDKDSVNFDKSLEQANELKDQPHYKIYCIKSQQTLVNSIDSAIENNNSSKAAENYDDNSEMNPLKELLRDADAAGTTTELKKTPSSPNDKIKAAAIKQTFKIKCRVRLKRLNIDEHSTSSKKKTWMAIPITKPEEPDKSANNDMENCDNMTETKSLLKKPCLKPNNKRTISELENKSHEGLQEVAPTAAEVTTPKKPKLEHEQTTSTEVTTSMKPKLEHEQTTTPTIETTATALAQQQPQLESSAVALSVSASTPALPLNNPTPKKSKSKHLKTVTFDLSNLNEELRGTSSSYNHKHKSKNNTAGITAGALGCYLKNSRPPRKLPDNTLRAAETLQLFVNTINDSTRTPPPAEFNKKRSPIKNKCIAEDETPRPPPASTLMDTPPCKKACTEKSRSQISSSKCKDQLVSSLATASISTISSDITTARIYTSSPLDQTLPEYDDNVDTVADSELILPNTAGSLRRKLKRPKKSLTRPVPVDDISTDDISNQPECNGEDDTDAVVDNEDDVFAEELLPIPAANEHILEEIVSARPTHIGSGTVIRDDYMNIEATATVPVYLFNDESRDLATPEPIQSSGDTTNVVDSSSYLNSSSSAATHNAMQAATASTTTSSSSSSLAMGNLEKSMLSPSEHEVSSTQETFYQTPTKSKQTGEGFGEKSSTSKDKGVGGSSTMSCSQKQKPEDSSFQNKDDQTSSTTGLLQNNQVDTTNHSPEMCTLALAPTTTTSPAMTNNHKIRKASTHDEILFNELQQQQQQQTPNKRKNTTTTTTTFCAESTSDNNNSKTNKVMSNSPDDNKSNRSLNKEHKLKKLLKEACKRDKNLSANELDAAAEVVVAVNTAVGGGGGSSPSTTTIINEEKVSSRTKRKKQKSSKSNKLKNHGERSTKIVLKASKLAAHVPTVNPLIITIPKSRLLRPPPTPTPSEDQLPQNEFLDIPNAKLFTEKEKDKVTTPVQSSNQKQQHHHHHQNPERTHSMEKKEWHQTSVNVSAKSKRTQSPLNTMSDIANIKSVNIIEHNNKDDTRNTNSTTTKTTIKEKSSGAAIIKKTLSEMTNKKSSNIVVGTQSKEVTHNTNSTTATTISAAKEKSSGAAIIKNKVKTSSTNNTTTNPPTNKKNNSNNSVIFAKDKYDLIKNKEKQATNEQQEAHKEKLKDKTSTQFQSKATTSSSSNIRLHKSSAKEKVKEKHKLTDKSVTQTQNVLKLNITLSSNNKALNSLPSASNSNSNVEKLSSSKSSKSSSNSTASSSATIASANAILKSKTNLYTQSLNTANAGSQITTPTSTSASSISTSPSVTIATNHVRKKLKTK